MQFVQYTYLGIIVKAFVINNFVTSQISDNEGWTVENPYNGATVHINDCGGNIIFGGYEIFGCYQTVRTVAIKLFILPPHYKLSIDIRLWRIDDWIFNSQKFYIFFDDNYDTWYYSDFTGSNLCGSSNSDESSYITLSYSLHTFNSVAVRLFSDCVYDNYWGITDFSLQILECYLGCQFCLDETQDCIMWILWGSYFNLQNLDNGFEGWIRNQFPQFQYKDDLQQKMLVINVGQSAINNFRLPDHSFLIIQFRYFQAQQIGINRFRIYLNDKQYAEEVVFSAKSEHYQSKIIADSSNQLKLEIRCMVGKIGFREFSIILRGPINLISCIDDNLQPFDGCFAKQESCKQGCTFCVKGECLMCDTKWVYNELTNNCEPLCGDKYIIADEQCDDGNNSPFDGCHKCQFSCPLNCQKCLFGKCQECITGYYYSNGICNQIYQNISEELEIILSINLNINQISYDSINQLQIQKNYYERSFFDNSFQMSQFQCQDFCQDCAFGRCIKCKDNYLLFKNQCISSITKKGVVLIEDGIHLNGHQIGCYQCNESCQIQCLICINSNCLQCIDGWQLIDGQCSQVCGDNLIAIISKEQCDSNLEDCLNCNINCPQNCQFCVNTQECLVCKESYIEVNHKCQLTCSDECKKCDQGLCLDNYSIEDIEFEIEIVEIKNLVCGDGIKQEQEQCDDGNNKQFDGCFNCQYSCPLNCLNCIDGVCQECDQYFQLRYNQCSEYCGNGIKKQDEQCDDGNIIDADGCSSSCKIDADYICYENNNGYSQCLYYESPYMILKFLNQTFNKYYIEISFSQQIYFKDDYVLDSLFNISMDEMGMEDFAIKIESNLDPISKTILNFQFFLEINLFISTNSSFQQCSIQLVNEAFNENDMKLINPLQKIKLKQYFQMNQADIEKAKKLTQYQEVMGIIGLVTGNFQMLIEILDNLQYLSYLKYINIQYPENLYQFFESTNQVSANPILDFFKINEIFDRYMYQDQIQSYAKLKFYGLNAHLITNLQFFAIQINLLIVFTILLKPICYICIKLCRKNITQYFIFLKVKSFRYKVLFKFISFIQIIMHQTLAFVSQFNKNGQMPGIYSLKPFYIYPQIQKMIKPTQYNQSYPIIFFLALIGYTIISLLKNSLKNKKDQINNRYKAFYLLKQLLFCYYLIGFQNDQFIQLLMLVTTNLIYVILMITVEMNLKTLEKIQQIISEISIIIFILTSILHLQDYNQMISGENQIQLGFSQIYLLICGLSGVFIKNIIMIYQKMKQQYLQRKKKERNKKFKKVTHLIMEVVS